MDVLYKVYRFGQSLERDLAISGEVKRSVNPMTINLRQSARESAPLLLLRIDEDRFWVGDTKHDEAVTGIGIFRAASRGKSNEIPGRVFRRSSMKNEQENEDYKQHSCWSYSLKSVPRHVKTLRLITLEFHDCW